jgi:hypothetical protein
MSELDKLRSGESVLIGQVMEAPGTISTLRMVAFETDKLDEIHVNSRVPALVSTIAYLKISTHEPDDPDEPKYVMAPSEHNQGASPEEIASFAERSIQVMKGLWPSEYEFARTVIVDDDDARICLEPLAIPGGLRNVPDLFPPGLGGNVTRTPSPISRWCRDPSLESSAHKQFFVPATSFISKGIFQVPDFT